MVLSRQAMEVAEPIDAKSVLAGGAFNIAFVQYLTGRLEEAGAGLDRVLTLSRAAGDAFYESFALLSQGVFKAWSGDWAAAVPLISEGLRLSRQHNLLGPLMCGSFCQAVALTGKGDYDDALAMFVEGLALTEKAGDEVWHHRLLNSNGWLHLELGDLDTAFDLNRRCAENARKRGDHETIANAEINLGDVAMVKGDPALAREFLDGVHRLVKDPATSEFMRWRYSTRLFASLGELSLTRGDADKAREFADQCLELATRTTARKNLVKGWRLKGEIALHRRQWDEAETALREALKIAEAIGNPTQLWKTHAALGRLYGERKNPDAAWQAYHAARLVIDGIRHRLQNPHLRASLDAAPTIQRVYQLSAPR